LTQFHEISGQVLKNIESAENDKKLLELSSMWIRKGIQHNYVHNFSWLGRPIIQLPQDIYAIQELIWNIKPDLVIETGIAHGGSLIMSASMLALIDYCEAADQGRTLDPRETRRRVLGVDIEIRPLNRAVIEAHPMTHFIEMIEGSSIDLNVVDQVKKVANEHNNILIFLDSNHTHEHVLAELEAYALLATVGSYCVVWDTRIEDWPENYYNNRPWGKKNNPKTAVHEYLKSTDCFEIDKTIEHKLLITAAPDGYLRRIR